MDLIGKVIGNRYEILEKIGNGGMATVYKAKCHILNRFVAVKVLRDEFTTDEEFIKRFKAEAQSAASLTHPNIVSIYDVGNEGDVYYIVMELIQGKTLKEIINEDGALPWKWAVNIAMQIASALETAHKNNIIHRDIKPHNIIITEDGIAKVTDFGIAKAVSNSTITAFGTTIGSVHYFSPEHARGGYTDAKSDLYSLGVVMYEMVTGKVPFDADTPVSIALKHMQEKPVEPIKINPAVPLAVNKIIIKAMQKEVSQRYSSATEMLKDLSLALKNPDGDFVVTRAYENDFPTQRMPIINDRGMEEKIKEKEQELGEEKKGKIATFFATHKVFKIILIVLACLAIFLGSLFATYAIINAKRPKQVQIPNLVGLTQEEAKAEAEKWKIEYKVSKEEFNKEVEEGKIISQKPVYKENYKILEKSTIEVVVSKGTELTTVPKLVGKTKAEAEQALKDANLVAEFAEEKSLKVEEGYVIKQEVEAETEVDAGTTVKVYVSIGSGIEQVPVPNVLGKTEEQARKEIADAKLNLTTVVNEEDSSKSDGVVLKQSIDPGTTVDEGSGITITVNKLPKLGKGTVIVNVKSLTGGNPKPVANTVTTDEKVQVKVTVGPDTVYSEKQSKDATKITVPVEGIGNVEIKVYIDDLYKGTTRMDFNTSNPTYTFE